MLDDAAVLDDGNVGSWKKDIEAAGHRAPKHEMVIVKAIDPALDSSQNSGFVVGCCLRSSSDTAALDRRDSNRSSGRDWFSNQADNSAMASVQSV
jgi:hypothetical protein